MRPEDLHGPFQLGNCGVDVLRRQRGQAGEAVGPLPRHAGDLVIDLLRRPDRLGGLPVVREQRGVDGYHLHVRPFGVHLRKPFLRRVPDLRRVDQDALAVAHDELVVALDLVPHSVPVFAVFKGPPQDLRGQVGVNVDVSHELSSATRVWGARA